MRLEKWLYSRHWLLFLRLLCVATKEWKFFSFFHSMLASFIPSWRIYSLLCIVYYELCLVIEMKYFYRQECFFGSQVKPGEDPIQIISINWTMIAPLHLPYIRAALILGIILIIMKNCWWWGWNINKLIRNLLLLHHKCISTACHLGYTHDPAAARDKWGIKLWPSESGGGKRGPSATQEGGTTI